MKVAWASETKGSGAVFAGMQNGRLHLVDGRGRTVKSFGLENDVKVRGGRLTLGWRSGKDDRSPALALRDGDGAAYWGNGIAIPSYVGVLPVRRVSGNTKLRSGWNLDTTATLHPNGRIECTTTLKNSHSSLGYTAGYYFELVDARDNVIYISPIRRNGIDAKTVSDVGGLFNGEMFDSSSRKRRINYAYQIDPRLLRHAKHIRFHHVHAPTHRFGKELARAAVAKATQAAAMYFGADPATAAAIAAGVDQQFQREMQNWE